jgi:primosomal protein N' (replication factor Y) (superfamily II helicase)
MYFYEVLVSSQRYHGAEPLTYSSEQPVEIGVVITIPMGRQTVLGIVCSQVEKPPFATKPIGKVVTNTPIPYELITLHTWLMQYYPGPSGMLTQLFLPSSLATTGRPKKDVHTKQNAPITLPSLTDEQATAVKTIKSGNGSFLLHGDTGSGKTRVYQELVKECLEAGRSALVLTPEIGLTPQLIESFDMAFPGRVITIHSTQTPAERRYSWLAIQNATEPVVVIGPRSALFSPIHSLGVVVVDEAHDSAYKQEQMPYYQATRVAAKLADLHQAKLILGSATPLVHDYYAFAAKGLPILRMQAAATKDTVEATIEVVNLKERENFSRSPWLSNQLIAHIEQALSEGSQSLVFLNRRGTARLVLCQNCGWQATCPRCDLPLTYHGDHHHLRCHTCGYTTNTPASCPTCGSADIQFKSVGTKTIVNEVSKLFPKAVVQRFDSDSKKSERLEQHYDDIKAGKVDILVGTQMLSKGLDLPRLSVVGVVVADTSLYFPDYTAEERTFQMLRQVIGRVGRGHREGSVIVQSYYPESPSIQAAVTRDYDQLYETQLKERELYRFPPYYFVLKIGIERASQSAASRTAQDLAEQILQQGFAVVLSGPAPAFLERTAGRYHWQLIVKAKQRTELQKIIATLPKNCTYDIDPSNLL